MSQRNIDFGSFPNDPSADAIRTAFEKVQKNFEELYAGQEAQAVLSVNKTAGAGITVNSPTGDVVVSAKIAQVQIQSTTLGLGTGSGPADAQSAIITSGVTPILIEIPSTVTNVANIVLTNTLTANFVIANANVSANNMSVTANISSGNIATGNIFITANANATNINATTGTFTSNVSALNYSGTNVTLSGNLTASSGNVNAARAAFTGNLTAGNASLGNYVSANFFQGDGSLLTGVVAVANSQILLGTSNVRILTTNGNVNTSVNGVANVFVVTSTGANVTGTINSTGNANVGNLGTAGSITATGNITGGNLIGTFANGTTNIALTGTAANVSVNGTGNVLSVANTGVTVTGVATVTGNANVGNLGTAGLITATGNITGGNINTAGKVTGSTLVSNVATGTAPLTVTSTTVVANLYASRANVSDYGAVTATSTGVFYPVFASGSASANYALAANSAFTANLANGSITAPTFIGTLSGAATSATTAGTVTTNAQPNITSVGSLTSLNVVGNTTSGNFVGVFANGTTNISIPVSGSAVVVNVGATANVLNINATGVNVSGTLNTGAGNANFGNVGFGAGQVTGTGNITAGNFIGAIAAGSNSITTTGNTNVGNLGFGAGQVTGTGNITAGNFIGAIAAGSNSITTTGNITGGNLIGPHANGTSNVNIPTASGNVNISVAGTANVVAVANTGMTVTGTATVTGNANVGNLGFGAGQVTGTGNITAGNFIGAIAAGANTIVTTGNANVGNLGTTGLITATGNINGGNINTAGKVTGSTLVSNVATGTAPLAVTSTTRVANLNVDYANVSDFSKVTNTTSGVFYPAFVNGSATANYALAANSAFTANLANGFLGATTLGGTLTTAAQPNITSVGTLTALAVSGNITSGNANLGNAATANFFVGNGAFLTGITVSAGSFILNGNSNVSIPAANGNVNISAGGAANVFVVNSTGAFVNGNLSATNITDVNVVSANNFTGIVNTASQPNITSLGNLTSLNMAGVANLGPIGNVKITGGVNNQFLVTDGTGNLNWLTPTTLTVAPGANTQVLFNDSANFGASGLFTFNKVSGNANVGNIGATNGVFTNVTGTLTTAAQPNITSVGTLSSLIVSGTSSLNTVSAKTASLNSGTVSSATPALSIVQEWSNASASFTGISASITDTSSLATSKLVDLLVGGVSKFAVDKGGNVTFAGIAFGNGSGLSSIAGSSITGSLSTSVTNSISNVGTITVGTWNSLIGSSATFASGLSGANLSSITGANVTGWVPNANVANYSVVNSQSTGIYYPTFVNGNTNGNYLAASNTAFSANLANGWFNAPLLGGTLTTAAQPNITSVGNLTSLTTGPITMTNVTSNAITSILAYSGADNQFQLTTQNGSSVAGDGNETARIGLKYGTGGWDSFTQYVRGTGPSNGRQVLWASNTPIANVSSTGIAVSGNVTATNLGGTLTTAAQPNITSVGTLAALTVGNATSNTVFGNGTVTVNESLGASWIINAKTSGLTNDTGIYVDAGNNFQFAARDGANTLRVVLDANSSSSSYINSGNVGIGTASPATKLNINLGATSDFVRVDSSTSSTFGHKLYSLVSGTDIATFTANGTSGEVRIGGVAASYFPTFYSGNSERMRIDTNGNVGIGNTAPAHTLAVTGTMYASGNITGGNLIGTFANGTSNIAIPAASGNITIATNGAEKIRVTTDGNVGFGVTIPNNKVDIGAATGVANSGMILSSGGSKLAQFVIANVGTSNDTLLGSITNNNLIFTAAGIERMRITNTGNIGIANTAPVHNVSVTGTMYVSGNANIGNIGTAGQIISSVATGTAPLTVVSTTRVNNLNVAYANVSDYSVVNAATTGIYYPTFASGSTTANYAFAANAAFSANLANGALIATTFVGALSGAATTAGTVTTAAQPNITSVSSSFTNLTFAANNGITLSGTTSSITGANLISATNITGTLTTAAQPNITSVSNSFGNLTLAANNDITLSGTGSFVSGANLVSATYLAGNASLVTALNASNISTGTLAQARLANSSVTINGTAVSLGASATITANTTQTLTLGSYLTGTSFNGGTAVTAAVDATTTATASKIVARDAGGNIAASYFIGNGSALTGIITSVSNVTNGTSNVNIASAGSNVTIGVGGTANVATFKTTGVNITGTLDVTGNITAPNVNASFFGSGAGLSSIPGANVTGTVANATYATSAGSATSASSVPWTGVSGRPTALSSFTNDTGYITNSVTGDILLTGELNMVSGTTTGRYIDHRGDLYMRYSDNSSFFNNRLLVGGATNYVHAYGNLEAEGNITAYSSDRRLKLNVIPIQDALEKINRIGGYTFDWDIETCSKYGFTPGNVHEHGVIAQEIEAIMPDVVTHAPFDKVTDLDGTISSKSGEYYKTVNYDKIVPLLIQAIKELSSEVEELKSRLK